MNPGSIKRFLCFKKRADWLWNLDNLPSQWIPRFLRGGKAAGIKERVELTPALPLDAFMAWTGTTLPTLAIFRNRYNTLGRLMRVDDLCTKAETRNLEATSKFQAPRGRPEAISMLRIYKYQATPSKKFSSHSDPVPEICEPLYYYGKAIPLQAWTGPEGSRRLRLPDFKTIGT